MADNLATPILSVCATIASRLPDLSIKDGQLIFVQDTHKIAFDIEGKRRFYNQIIEIATDEERAAILAPISGSYYFVIDTAVLWTYQSEWIPLTTSPEKIVFIGTDMPELGSAQTLYVNKEEKYISVWDDTSKEYMTVADKTDVVSESDIDLLFA